MSASLPPAVSLFGSTILNEHFSRIHHAYSGHASHPHNKYMKLTINTSCFRPLFTALCFAVAATTAKAQVVTVNLNGTLISNADVFTIGQPYTASFTINLGAPLAGTSPNIPVPTVGYYNAITGISINIGNGAYVSSLSFASSPLQISVTNHPTQDYYIFNSGVTSYHSFPTATATGNYVRTSPSMARLFDISGTALSSISLANPAGLNWFSDGDDYTWFEIQNSSGVFQSFATGTPTSVTVSAIPEPSTYAAIFGGVALAGAAFWRRRRSNR